MVKGFFPALLNAVKDFFLQCSNFFRQVFPCNNIFLRNQAAGYFFLKSPIPPLKQMVGPLDATYLPEVLVGHNGWSQCTCDRV